MSRRYLTAAAFRVAVETRLRQQAEASRRDLQWLRRRLVFTRILARLAAAAPDAWVLKGGMAVELRRPGLARATRDIDLVMRFGVVDDPSDVEQVREALLESLIKDVDGDWFVFGVSGGVRLSDDSYGRPAWRFLIEARLAGKRFAELRSDVVARPEELAGIEQRALPDVLGFAGIPPRLVQVTDLRQQYAEKIHAMTRSYPDGTSSRVKDLVDLVLLIEDGVSADPDPGLRDVVQRAFKIRATHEMPMDLPVPPASWRVPFERLATEVGLPVTSYLDAHALVAQHWRQAMS